MGRRRVRTADTTTSWSTDPGHVGADLGQAAAAGGPGGGVYRLGAELPAAGGEGAGAWATGDVLAVVDFGPDPSGSSAALPAVTGVGGIGPRRHRANSTGSLLPTRPLPVVIPRRPPVPPPTPALLRPRGTHRGDQHLLTAPAHTDTPWTTTYENHLIRHSGASPSLARRVGRTGRPRPIPTKRRCRDARRTRLRQIG